MPSLFEPPPTYADPVLVDEESGKSRFNPIGLKWFLDVAQVFIAIGAPGSGIQHNTLAGLQGGQASQFYHLTLAQLTNVGVLATGITATVALAKLTGLGTDGSLTVTDGIITAYVAPT